MNNYFISIILLSCVVLLQSCQISRSTSSYNSSVMDYLYPSQQVVVQPSVPVLKLPITVGIAFVPEKVSDSRNSSSYFPTGKEGLDEREKMEAIELVRREFASHNYIKSIQIIPSMYMQPHGGFENLSQISRMFDVDVVVLISYDQVQHNDSNLGSLLYLTLVGSFIVPGNTNDTFTMIDATVFHVESRKLLFRAPGVSRVAGSSTEIDLKWNMQRARYSGFNLALQNMIPNLQWELEQFKVRMKQTPEDYQVVCEPGYKGAGAMGLFGAIGALGLAFYAVSRRKS